MDKHAKKLQHQWAPDDSPVGRETVVEVLQNVKQDRKL